MLLSIFAAVAMSGQTPTLDAAALYKKTLPSIVRIETLEADGVRSQGTAFLAIKDGLAVTCWHVVRNAESAKIKFSDGEEYEVSGLVDKDEKRDVALVRVKVADRPLLSFAKGDPEVGSKAFAIGSPEGLDFSISDGVISQIRNGDGVRYYQFSCPVSHGSSGGPLLNDKGEVLGLVSMGMKEGQNLNFAAPITYVKGLDSTLATTPWDKVKKEKKQPGKGDAGTLRDYLAETLRELHRYSLPLHWTTEELMANHIGYVDSLFIEASIRLGGRGDALKEVTVEGKLDDVREVVARLIGWTALAGERLRQMSIVDTFECAAAYVAAFRLVEVEQATELFGGEELEPLRKAIGDRLLKKLTAPKDQKGWRPGEMGRESRKRFVGGYSLLSRLAYDVDSTGYVFGFLVDADDPAKLFDVQGRTPPNEWGFRKGDVVVSVAGKSVGSFEEMKAELIKIGKKTSEVIVRRKDREIKLWVNPSGLLKD